MSNIGAHVSAAGGVSQALLRAEELGISTIQIFGSSPRQWQVRPVEKKELDRYFSLQEERLVEPVFLHAPYLVNLATDNLEIRDKSIEALSGHLLIAESIKAFGLVFHVGSSAGSKEKALERTAAGVSEVLQKVPGQTHLIIENSVRGGNKVGISPAEIGFLIQAINSQRVSVCLDTAHAFQSGLMDYTPDKINRCLGDWEDKLGLDRLSLLHLNDSATEFNSGHDRHANIGEGLIGLDGFRLLAGIAPLNSLPWILETPGFGGEIPDL
jgi:deoxyribonuclease IV